MARSLCTTVDEKAEGQRLDVFLAGAACYPSRSSAAKHIENGDVFVNGNSYSKKDTVCAHDVVVYTEEEAQKHIPLQGDPIPLDIRYDDDCMIVLSKTGWFMRSSSTSSYWCNIGKCINLSLWPRSSCSYSR